MSNTTFLLALVAAAALCLLGLFATAMLIDKCGWSVLLLGKQAFAAYLFGFCGDTNG